MNNSKTPNHPWRTRTHEFANHLTLLSRTERQKIETAEQEYLARREDRNSPQRRAARDFDAIMQGVHENV